MYDADTRRFMAVDPVKGDVRDPQTMVQHSYCLNNPIIFVDPFGKAVLPGQIAVWNIKDEHAAYDYLFDSGYFVVVNSRRYVALREGYYDIYKNVSGAGKATLTVGNDEVYVTIGAGDNKIGILFDSYQKQYPKDGVYATVKKEMVTAVTLFTAKLFEKNHETRFQPPEDMEEIKFIAVKDPKAGSLKILVDFNYFNQIICLALGEQYMPKILPNSSVFSEKNLIWPTKKPTAIRTDNDFGPRKSGHHGGIDLFNKKGEPIFAAASGVVIIKSETLDGWGKHVKIKHDDIYDTLCAHLFTISVSKGQVVLRGTQVGLEGNTGNVSPRPENPDLITDTAGAHLHFEVYVKGQREDPLDYLPGGEALKNK
jgi:murein DD-endopeptidase MepM/ murein hydrolase activator NlpD